jgi:mannonate dehydratase
LVEHLDRRNFLGASGFSAGAAVIAALAPTGAALAKDSAGVAAGGARKPILFKLGCQSGYISGPPEPGHPLLGFPTLDEHFGYYARYGVKNVCGYFDQKDPSRLYPTVDELNELVEMGRRHGISVDMTETVSLGSGGRISQVTLGGPGRDREIEAFNLTLKNCAAAGIPILKYNLRILPVLSSGKVKGRGDSTYRQWRLKDALDAPMTEAGRVDGDTFWERITYFLERVVPVANEYKVRIACHPQDPGTPNGYRGIDRVLGTVDGLKKFVSIMESPYHGLNFCQGTISEDLRDPANEIFDVIRWFGKRKKIFNVHFRNIHGHRDDFTEAFPDDGVVDFVRAIRVYQDVGYDGMIMPDHVPIGPPGATLQSFAFAYGHIRGLMQSAAQF